MRSRIPKMALSLATVAIAFASFASATHAAVIINEVYPGGGSSSGVAAYQKDFVELYNTSLLPVDLTGYQLLYAPGTAATFTGTIFSFATGSILGAQDYLLIFTGSAGTGGAPVPTLINGTGNASLSASVGSVEITDGTNVLDLVGWGAPTVTTTPKFEGTAVAAPATIGLSLSRTLFGDTNVNSADFTSGTPSPTFGATSTAVAVVTPEPASLGLIALGGMALLGRRRK